MHFTTSSEQETKNFGQQFATHLKGGDIVCLYGELGAGKTTLVKGIAAGLGIKEEITSPTFTLMNIYKLSAKSYQLKALVHIDTYRLKDEKELIEIGVEDYLGQPGTVTIIEWPEKIEGLLKDKPIKKITLEHLQNQTRKISLP
ncbi:MAG TPA: tRNA (adenosine(37)-N6)-threonylcarbamoyltransferase complex ATPase subunit type 1 TsaE [Patescibacteria group bacterium]|nr:tRNA (adenosine(37)-N6)-threonylcarbamoyltransferase complex ATPase subunit type 1 TsaE [Patescibacteria group bacterium]